MEFKDFVQWVFYGVIGGSTVYGVGILANLKRSIDELNIHVAQIIEKTTWHEKELERHETRLSRLEQTT